jgi:uncharacterized protein
MKVLITGSTGFLGRALINTLEKRGDTVVPLTRPNGWDPDAGTIDRELIAREAPDAVVHLAGENIGAKRWSAAQKTKILETRTKGTDLIARTLASLDRKPRVFISASAIGVYGNRGEEPLTDEATPGTGYLADVCKAWEDAAAPAREAGIRVVHPRLGVVLAKDGGALKRMITPFKMFVGGRLGSGKQWMSWVAREDVVGAIIYALERDALSGALNVVSPHPVRNSDFTKALARALRRPAIFPVPAFMLRLVVGEMADEALLASSCVLPARLQALSFPFRFSDVYTLLEKITR